MQFLSKVCEIDLYSDASPPVFIATSTSLKRLTSGLKRISLSRIQTKGYFTTGSLVRWARREGGRREKGYHTVCIQCGGILFNLPVQLVLSFPLLRMTPRSSRWVGRH